MLTLALQSESRISIGVVGYSAQSFKEAVAASTIGYIFDQIQKQHPGYTFEVVSGLTDLGIPAIAYRQAALLNWKTVGIACSKAADYECYPVDETVIVGTGWGDESEAFIDRLDVLVRVGGGEQSLAEVAMAKAAGVQTYEFELKAEVAA